MKQRECEVLIKGRKLSGFLGVPEKALGLVIFAHGSGSSRFSPRNNFVAEGLQRAGFATLLFDLLEEREAENRRLVFDIGLLAERLIGAFDWAVLQPELKHLPVGFFGASTGAAAALVAAARLGPEISAVVSRGGRPDLAEGFLESVESPVLLIVGEEDYEVVELNRQALDAIHAPKELVLVPGATHLFEEAGTLEEALKLATEWFERFVADGRSLWNQPGQPFSSKRSLSLL